MESSIQEMDNKTLVVSMCADKGVKLSQLSEKVGRNNSSFSTMLSNGSMKLNVLLDIFEALDEELVVNLKNGKTIKLVK